MANLMKQVYRHYTMWEDYKNGMYNTSINNEDYYIQKAVEILTNEKLFYRTAKSVLEKWKIASMVNLTNKNCNKQAWIGQASCSICYKVPEYLTRIAWSKLTDEQREAANKIADKIIYKFNQKYEAIDNQLYLFMD